MQVEPCSLAQPWQSPPTSGFLAGEDRHGVCVFGDGQEICPAILSHQHCLEKRKPLTTCCYLLSSEAAFQHLTQSSVSVLKHSSPLTGLPGSSVVETLPAVQAAHETRVHPWSGRAPGGGHGNPLQCSCLENPMARGAWWAAVHGATKSGT